MKCSQCNAEIPADSKFCGSCGTPATAPLPPKYQSDQGRFCNQCGTKAEDPEKFCLKCGAQIKNQALVQTPAFQSIQSQIISSPSPGMMSLDDFEEPHNIILPDSNKKKSPFLAAMLSFFFPGIGQVYVGQVAIGLLIFGSAIILGPATLGALYLGGMLVRAYLAYKAAMNLYEGKPIHRWMKEARLKNRLTQ
jgi:TM2 domain-containing membrane protein YozV